MGIDRLTCTDLAQNHRHLVGSIRGTEQFHGSADDLFGRVAVQPLGRWVPAGDDPVERLADDGIVRMLDYRCQPPHPVLLLNRLLAFGDVAHCGDHQQAVLAFHLRQADVHRKLGAIALSPAQLKTGAHGPCLGVGKIAFTKDRVNLPQRLGHQRLQRLADEGFAGIAEQQLGSMVDEPDHACLVHSDHGIGHCFKQAVELFVLQRHLFAFPSSCQTNSK